MLTEQNDQLAKLASEVRAARAERDLSRAERDALIIRAVAEGWTYRAIGAEVGITGARVQQIVKRARETPVNAS